MSKGIFIGLAGALFAGLYALNLGVYRPRIERDLAMRTRKALEMRSFKVTGTLFSGRDGLVHILSSDGSEIPEAKQAANEVFGVRTVEVSAEIESNLPPSFRARRMGENLTLSGTLPTEKIKQVFLTQAHGGFSGFSIVDEITVSAKVGEPAYLTSLPSILNLLTTVGPEAVLELEGTTVRLAAEVPNAETARKVEGAAQSSVPQGIRIEVHLKTPDSMGGS